jgi:hypothetical protein
MGIQAVLRKVADGVKSSPRLRSAARSVLPAALRQRLAQKLYYNEDHWGKGSLKFWGWNDWKTEDEAYRKICSGCATP